MGREGAGGLWCTAARVLVWWENGREGWRRRRGMGDDEFVGGENGEEKRLIVFPALDLGDGGGLVEIWPGWWFAAVRCGAVCGAAEGARGRQDWTRETGVEARRAGVLGLCFPRSETCLVLCPMPKIPARPFVYTVVWFAIQSK